MPWGIVSKGFEILITKCSLTNSHLDYVLYQPYCLTLLPNLKETIHYQTNTSVFVYYTLIFDFLFLYAATCPLTASSDVIELNFWQVLMQTTVCSFITLALTCFPWLVYKVILCYDLQFFTSVYIMFWSLVLGLKVYSASYLYYPLYHCRNVIYAPSWEYR